MGANPWRLALLQCNPAVGDLEGNAALLLEARDEAARRGADLALAPSGALTGRPADALLERPAFAGAAARALDRLSAACRDGGPALLLGGPCGGALEGGRSAGRQDQDKDEGAAAGGRQGERRPAGALEGPGAAGVVLLDEGRRSVSLSSEPTALEWRGRRIGALSDDALRRAEDPAALAAALVEAGAEALLVAAADPWRLGRGAERDAAAAALARAARVPVAFANLVGGQDGLVFDGGSRAFDAAGAAALRAPRFRAAVALVDIGADGGAAAPGDGTALAPMPGRRPPAARGPFEGAEEAPEDMGAPPPAMLASAIPIEDFGGGGGAPAPSEDGAAPFVGGGPEALPEPEGDDGEASLWAALVLAVRDCAAKNRLGRALVGLSGGIDSALVLALAVDALGAERVSAAFLPSRHTSEASWEDAEDIADALGVALRVMDLEPPREAVRAALGDAFPDLAEAAALEPTPEERAEERRRRRRETRAERIARVDAEEEGPVEAPALAPGALGDLVEQNLQARLRGVLLTALSNRDGSLLLATGNKSEAAVGYATLYGDTCGGFAPIGDLWKTQVRALARWRDARSPVFPARVLERAPSAELRDGQEDEDDLPPYEVLDALLRALVEEERSVGEAAERAGAPLAVASEVWRRLLAAEFKRRQSPTAPAVSRRPLAARGWPVALRLRPPAGAPAGGGEGFP